MRNTQNMLFDEFWSENEICLLFSDTNLPKSKLAVQIADSISKGIPISGLRLESSEQKVLYCDLELSDKQFQSRYSDEFGSTYQFHNNFIRAQVNRNETIPKQFQDFESLFLHSLEQIISSSNIKILIIDNLTYLSSYSEGLSLMKRLNALKRKYNLSILILAHASKSNSSNPLTKNDLHGSMMLIDHCDSCFAIGESSVDQNHRYLKQLKSRNAEIKFNSENIVVMSLTKTTNFLQFQFIENGSEKDHLTTLDK